MPPVSSDHLLVQQHQEKTVRIGNHAPEGDGGVSKLWQTLLARSLPAWPLPSAADSWRLLHMSHYPKLNMVALRAGYICLQDAVRGEYVEETKLLLDRGGKIYENGKVRKGPMLSLQAFVSLAYSSALSSKFAIWLSQAFCTDSSL